MFQSEWKYDFEMSTYTEFTLNFSAESIDNQFITIVKYFNMNATRGSEKETAIIMTLMIILPLICRPLIFYSEMFEN